MTEPDRTLVEQREPDDDDIRKAAEAYAKRLEWDRQQPLGPLVHLRQAHVMRGEGDGTTIYFGRHRGAGYFGMDLRGFSGWSSSPRWMPGGWEFRNPTIYVGRLFTEGRGRNWSCEVKVPAGLYRRWKWLTSPTWRRIMREPPQEAKP